jgi:nitrate/nitrite transporter NarK
MTADRGKIGSFLHVFGLIMASISKGYYQFLLSQAVCSSIGASMVFYPAFSATVSWFFEKRAMAFGIAAAGSSLGGVIFPIMVTPAVPSRWYYQCSSLAKHCHKWAAFWLL